MINVRPSNFSALPQTFEEAVINWSKNSFSPLVIADLTMINKTSADS